MVFFRDTIFFTLAPAALALVRPNGVGRLPALGWNSWNAYGCDINEAKFMDAANDMVSLGLKNAGYEYVNIDDCWSVKSGRDSKTQEIKPDLTKFPQGISGLAKKIHDMGLKLGIYSSSGTVTCADYPASLGYEDIDAASFASWGVDYLKYDNCGKPGRWFDSCEYCRYSDANPKDYVNGTCINHDNLCPEGYDYSKSKTAQRYRTMRDALLDQDRTILYSLCEWGQAGVQYWGNATGNSWRMSSDIKASFASVLSILNMNSFLLNSVNFWGHNDMDMLEVGNNLSAEESRTHFAFWAAMKSPLIIGTDISKLNKHDLGVLLNPYLLAFNQDSKVGAPAKPFKWGTNPDWTFNATHPAEYWSGESSNGTLVLLLNTLKSTRSMTARFGDVPGLQSGKDHRVVDVWTGQNMGTFQDHIKVSVASKDTRDFLVQRLK